MPRDASIRGSILIPNSGGTVTFLPDGVIAWDAAGIIKSVGPFHETTNQHSPRTSNLILPPFLDAHIHIPQWPIRGRFCDGLINHPPEGRLLAGLNLNVFPFESRCAAPDHVAALVANFAADTLAKGVVGGAAYMTVHADAVHHALATLGPLWSVGLVLMNMNCPAFLRTDERALDDDFIRLAGDFGRRFIVTDRFAVAVDSPLRRRAVSLADRLGLRTQTHLNEQPREKHFVEKVLYPSSSSYTDVYASDGLLNCDPILAHCIHMTDAELSLIANSDACIAHCPTSNTLLGSGIMPLDRIAGAGIDYAICTDVGASPTTSMLHEMAQYLFVHAGRSNRATPSEALVRATLAPARMLDCVDQVGTLVAGRPASFIEVAPSAVVSADMSADDVIAHCLLGLQTTTNELNTARDELAPGGLDNGPALDSLTRAVNASAARLEDKVQLVVIHGQSVFVRGSGNLSA